MSNRNREAGHNWERVCIDWLKKYFPFAVSSRSESKRMDDKGVDIMNHNEADNGRMKLDFQCKNTATKADYPAIIDRMPNPDKAVVLHKLTKKSKEGKFMPQGEYAIMRISLFREKLDVTDLNILTPNIHDNGDNKRPRSDRRATAKPAGRSKRAVEKDTDNLDSKERGASKLVNNSGFSST